MNADLRATIDMDVQSKSDFKMREEEALLQHYHVPMQIHHAHSIHMSQMMTAEGGQPFKKVTLHLLKSGRNVCQVLLLVRIS